MTVVKKDKPQFTVYLHGAKVYHVHGKIYRRGDAFVGDEDECNHLLNQRQYGGTGTFLWQETPMTEVVDGRRGVTKAALPVRKLGKDSNGAGAAENAPANTGAPEISI